MRSRTDPALPGRCPRCWLVRAYCVCAQVPALAPPVELVIVRHHAEARRSSGTARLALLAIPGSGLVECGADLAAASAALADRLAAAPCPTWLLFPDGGATAAPAPPPRRLVVLDGTWREVRRMLHRLPALHPLPRLSLPAAPPPPLRLRQAPSSESRSTLEAIADALALLGDEASARALHELYRRFAEQGLRARGTFGYHSRPVTAADDGGPGPRERG